MERTNINTVTIVGTVEEVSTKVNEGNGKKFINGKIVVKVVEDGKESLVDVKVLAFEKTKSGDVSKIYTAFSRLDGYMGKRVKLSAELRDEAMVRGDGAVVHFNSIYLKFVNDARAEEADCARFEYSGFVVKGIYERRDKEDNLLGYKLEVAQQNYNGTNMSVIRFDVDKHDTNIASAIEANYVCGETVKFEGKISYITTIETKVTEVAFGESTPKTYVNVEKTYRITGGSEPFDEDNVGRYTKQEIASLIDTYKKSDIERVERSKVGSESFNESSAASAMNKLTRSLI